MRAVALSILLLCSCAKMDEICGGVQDAASAQERIMEAFLLHCEDHPRDEICKDLYKTGKAIDHAAEICFDD